MTDSLLAERIVGCILGGAVGDAMGGPYEGSRGPVTYEPPDVWLLSDDTQLTLATCEAIAANRRVDPQDVADRFLVWLRGGRITGIGGSTFKALRDLDMGAHWALSGAQGERAAGNGAAMRAAPLAFVLDPEVAADRTTIRDVCRITHRNDEAYIGALAIIVAIRQVSIAGENTRCPPSLCRCSQVAGLPCARSSAGSGRHLHIEPTDGVCSTLRSQRLRC